MPTTPEQQAVCVQFNHLLSERLLWKRKEVTYKGLGEARDPQQTFPVSQRLREIIRDFLEKQVGHQPGGQSALPRTYPLILFGTRVILSKNVLMKA